MEPPAGGHQRAGRRPQRRRARRRHWLHSRDRCLQPALRRHDRVAGHEYGPGSAGRRPAGGLPAQRVRAQPLRRRNSRANHAPRHHDAGPAGHPDMTIQARKASAGFSLIELMVALTIGLVVLTVLATVFARTSSGRGDLERVSRLVENSRFAADIVGDDVRHAGFYGTFMPPSDTVFSDPAPCGWNTADITQLGWQPTASPPRYPAQLQGFDDPAATLAALNCLPNRVAGTDVLVIRRASSRPVLPAQVSATSIYVQASQCINDPVLLRVSNTAGQFTLRTAACDAANLAAIRRYFVRVYYVASCNEC